MYPVPFKHSFLEPTEKRATVPCLRDDSNHGLVWFHCRVLVMLKPDDEGATMHHGPVYWIVRTNPILESRVSPY